MVVFNKPVILYHKFLARLVWVVLMLLSLFFLFSSSALAAPADGLPIGGEDDSAGSSEIGKINPDVLGVPTDVNDIISNLVQLAYAVAGLIFFFMLLYGGIRYLTAGGDEKAAAAARATLTQAFIGLVIVVAAFLITQLIFNLFGIEGFISLG